MSLPWTATPSASLVWLTGSLSQLLPAYSATEHCYSCYIDNYDAGDLCRALIVNYAANILSNSVQDIEKT